MAGNQNSGRHAKPAIVHLLNGNPSKRNREALEQEQAQPLAPVEAPPMPDWLSPEAQAEWARIVPDLEMLGLISRLDRQAMAHYCEAAAEYRFWTLKMREFSQGQSLRGDVQTYRSGAQDLSVWRKLRNDAERRANEAGSRFGLSPLARRSLKAVPPQGELFPNEQKRIADKYF